jgi:hypothetical protein
MIEKKILFIFIFVKFCSPKKTLSLTNLHHKIDEKKRKKKNRHVPLGKLLGITVKLKRVKIRSIFTPPNNTFGPGHSPK